MPNSAHAFAFSRGTKPWNHFSSHVTHIFFWRSSCAQAHVLKLMCSSSRPATVVEFTFANNGPNCIDKQKNILFLDIFVFRLRLDGLPIWCGGPEKTCALLLAFYVSPYPSVNYEKDIAKHNVERAMTLGRLFIG